MDNKTKLISQMRAEGFDVSYDGEKYILRRFTAQKEEVEIPGIISEIGEYAFYDNKKIKKVTFSGNIKTIGTSAFEDCSSLEYVSPLVGVSVIHPYAFSYTIKLENVVFSEDLSHIGEYAFCGSGIRNAEIPGNIKRVSFKAFFACPRLGKAYLGGDGAVYEESAFANCMKLTSVFVSDGVRSLERRAFSYCKILDIISIGKNTHFSEDTFEAVPGEIIFRS